MAELKPCIVKIELPQQLKDYIISQREVHAKKGLSEKQADLLTAKELQEKTLDELHNVYNKLGVKGYENAIEPKAELPETKIPNPTEKESPPNEPPIETGEGTVESEKVTGVKKSITTATRAANNLPKVEFSKMRSDIVELNEAKKRIDSGESDPQKMVDRILKEKVGYASEAEVFDMQYYAHQLEKKSVELSEQAAEAKSPEEKLEITQRQLQLSDLIDAQTEAAQLAGNKWGKIGNAMQPVINDAGLIFRENKNTVKEAYGGEVPKDVQDRLDAITKQRDEALAAKAKVEEQLRQKMAEKGFEEVKKQAARQSKNKEDKEALLKEEKELIEQLKAEFKGDPNAPKRSGSFLTDKMIIIAGKLAINYVKQGVNGIEALVDKMYDALKSYDLSRKDIKDFLANYEPVQAQQEINRLNKKADILQEKLTPPTIKTKGNKFSPSEMVDLAKPSKVQKTFRTNTEWVKANQRVAEAEFRMKIEKRKAFDSKKNMYQRGLAWAGRLTRLSVLSGTHVLYKLAAAATIGSALKRIPEQAIGAVYSAAFKGIAEKAPIEGYWNAKSEAKFYKEFLNPKKFYQNTVEILKSGSSKLGKRLGSAEYEHIPLLYLPTDTHQIIKDPPKRATFEASFRNSMVWAEKNGLDINDPLVINSLENAAYKRAMYEIFQEQNWLSKKFTSYKSSLEKSGNSGATAKFLVDFMIPVSTVPTNIVRRVITTSPLGLIRGGKEVIQAYRKGIEKLTPDEADHVMQQLKQGSLGTALWLIGWFGYQSFGGLYSQFNPNKKREEGDKISDEMEVGGAMIPKAAQHALPLEVIQFAATARRIYENYRNNKNATIPEAIYKAGLGSIGAALEQVPVISTGVHAVMATKDPVEAEKLKEDISRRVVPQIVREHTDKTEGSDDLKFLDDKGLKIVDLHKEALHPIDKNGKDVFVTDELFKKVSDLRREKIKKAISKLRKNDGFIWSQNERVKAKDMTTAQTRAWLMSESTKAKNEAIEEIFGEQPEKEPNPKVETID